MKPLSPRAVDAGLAAGVLVACVAEAALLEDVTGPRWLTALAGAAMSLLLLWRRTHPVAAAVAVVALAVPTAGFLVDASAAIAMFFPLLILAYSGGAYAEQRTALAALGVLAGGVLAVGLAGGSTGDRLYFPVTLVLLSWLGGRYVRTRIRTAAELHETAAAAAERREREAQRAVAEERRRIAREMHDVVAHSISIMVVQAGGARRILVADPERAEHAAARIRRAGSDALAEMDILLGVLETPPPGAAPPTLDDLAELVERARAAGLPVTLAVSGARAPLPSGAELAVYRVVQEALTNAIKHAGGASTRVELSWGAEALDLVVADDGRGGPSPQLAGAGHGLMGMRERLRVYGGDVDSGPRPGGGFEVAARLPVRRSGAGVA